MSTRSGRIRQSVIEASPPRTRKGVSPPRSPARNRKSSPTGRSSQKSPSRKSPSRKSTSKYPARKSPSRALKEDKDDRDSSSAPKSPAKRPAIKKNAEVRLEDVSSKIEHLRSTRTRRLEYSVSDISSVTSKTEVIANEKVNGLETASSITDVYGLRSRRPAEEVAPRRSSRLRDVIDSIPDIRRSISKSLSKSVSKSISKSIDTYSDEEGPEDILPKEKSTSVTRKLATPLPSSVTLSQLSERFEFFGRIGSALLYILIPLTVFSILVSCSKSCSYKVLQDIESYKSSTWFTVRASSIAVVQYIVQAIFLSIPIFGSKGDDEHVPKCFFNASFSSFCTLTLLFVLDFYKISDINSILNSYLQLATVSYLVAVFLAIIMYLKSRKVKENDINPYGNSGYILYDFFMGKQIQINLLNINVKLWLARISNISTLILSILIFKHGVHLQKDIDKVSLEEFQNMATKMQLKPTILVYSVMQIVYALYFITRERKITTTFYWQSEGLGYLQIVSSALYPYYFTSISKNIMDTDLQLSTNVLIFASILYSLGFVIMLISNNIKYEFRKNPLQPSLVHLDSMPTFHGKKLLVSHLWGYLRHPNYTGDIMIHLALAVPGILTRQIVAAAPAFITIVMLVHRSWRDHGRCRRRYGAAWNRYCKKVPSVIVPKVL